MELKAEAEQQLMLEDEKDKKGQKPQFSPFIQLNVI